MSTIFDRTAFSREIGELYAHLYDLVYLRAHPLAEALVQDLGVASKERGWRLHDLLLRVIKDLDPGPQAPAYSKEWRRHRLMVERYGNALEPGAVMQIIAVSRRQYYREHEAAIEAVAGILWEEQYVAGRDAPAELEPPVDAALDRIELLRLEAARLARASRHTHLAEVVGGVLAILDEHLRQHRLTVRLALPETLPVVSVDKGLLRQVLLGLLGYLIERATDGEIALEAAVVAEAVCIALRVAPPGACRLTTPAELQERLAAFREIAALTQASVTAISHQDAVVGFDLRLPSDTQPLVLVVDDNEDVLELFRRLLMPHGYRLITATTAEQALTFAVGLQPHVIILDLMLPGQDGWDLLQLLLNRPETQRIPVIICSVLKQKELALSLGAAAFLGKPVTEQPLLEALQALQAA